MEPQVVAALIAAGMALVVASVSALVSVYSAVISSRSQLRVARLTDELERDRKREDREAELEQVMARYREPLGQAAYDLQSRIFNILKQDLVRVHVEHGDERSRSYVHNNTVFLIGQYFAWMEIIRREIQFIDLGANEQTPKLAQLRDDIYSLWQTDMFDPPFRVFAGEQRAIGEIMVREGSWGAECMGYAEFLRYQNAHEEPLLTALRSDVERLQTTLLKAEPRLRALQHALIDLLDLLDPECVRFPKEKRTKV